MPTAVKEEQFELNSSVPGMSENDLAAATVDNSLQIIFEYEVPVGVAIVFTAEDTLSAYLEDDGVPAECIAATVYIDLVIMDSSKLNVRSVLNVCQYGNIKEFQDADKLRHLDIAPGSQIIANEGERICFRANSRTSGIASLDVSASHWRLTSKRIRHTLY